MRSRAAYLMVRDRGWVLGGYSAAALLGADCGSTGSGSTRSRSQSWEVAG